NPRVAVPTRDVFARLAAPMLAPSTVEQDWGGEPFAAVRERDNLFALLTADRNDLEAPALAIAPPIADVLASLRTLPGCRLARMSGSGATCFALFDSQRAAIAGARALRSEHPSWWVRATALAGG